MKGTLKTSLKDGLSFYLKGDDLRHLKEHGASRDFGWMLSFGETNALYHTYQDEIWILLAEAARQLKCSVIEFIHTFPRSYSIRTSWMFRYMLVCWAAQQLL